VTQLATEALRGYHRNPRRGRVDVIQDSIEQFGQYRSIVVNLGTKTGRRNEVLVGNHTWQAARAAGLKTVEAKVIDVDDDTAARIVLADNRTSDSGGYDNETLLDLLESLDTIDHTGYTGNDLDDLLVSIEPVATPEVDPQDYERFTRTSMRAMYVEYDTDEFITVQGTLQRLCAEHGQTSNAAVVALLARRARGTA
jgi:hypothetical protein